MILTAVCPKLCYSIFSERNKGFLRTKGAYNGDHGI